jgi:hypothetical protein
MEHLHSIRDDLIDIHQCETCGATYLCEQSEVNDWGSGGGDYSEVMRRWLPLRSDEIDAARANPNFRPQSTDEHRESPGWRRDG